MATLGADVLEQLQAATNSLVKLQEDAQKLLSILKGTNSSEPLNPLHKAQALQAMMVAVHTAHQLNIRTRGINPSDQDHVKKEDARIAVYQKKVNKATAAEFLRANRPTISLNVEAANRFIDHAIPDLTAEQRAALKSATEATKRKAEELDEARGQGKKQKKKDNKEKESSKGRTKPGEAKAAAKQFLEQFLTATAKSTQAANAANVSDSDGEPSDADGGEDTQQQQQQPADPQQQAAAGTTKVGDAKQAAEQFLKDFLKSKPT